MKIKTTDTHKTPILSNHLSVSPKLYPTLNFPTLSHRMVKFVPSCKLILEWLIACNANGLSSKTLEDYSNKAFKFWWWWTEGSKLAEKLGSHPSNITVKVGCSFITYFKRANSQ